MFSTNSQPLNSLLVCIQQAALSGAVPTTDIANALDTALDIATSQTIHSQSDSQTKGADLPTDYTPNNLGNRIQIARENLGISEVDLAEKLDIHPGYVLTWEDGTDQPLAGMIIPLANALRCDPMWLLTGENSNRQYPATPVHQSRSQYSAQQRSAASDHASHHVKHQSQA
ncbi:helix-turn-helix domain-containing protein [Salmonella enterica]|nr:helix-turn-helix domain-containing protein [Salmonella enterica]